MKKFVRRAFALTCVIFIHTPVYSNAFEPPSTFRYSGFATLGVMSGGGDEDIGYRKSISRDGVFDDDVSLIQDSVLGFQIDAQANEKVSGALQLIYYHDRQFDHLDDYFNHAYIKYHVSPKIQLRAGKIGSDLFMLSDNREVGFSYLWARPPIEYYGLMFDTFTGADVAYITKFQGGHLKTRFLGGVTETPVSIGGSHFDVNADRFLGSSISWESNQWKFRINYTNVVLDDDDFENDEILGLLDDLEQAAADNWPEADKLLSTLSPDDIFINYYSAGIGYENHQWVLQSEINYIDTDFEPINTIIGQYLSIGYKVETDLTVYGLVAKSKDTSDRIVISDAPANYQDLQDDLQELYDFSHTDQINYTAGTRWNVLHNLALKLQFEHIKVKAAGGSLLDQKAVVDKDRVLNVYSASLNYVF